MTHLGACIVRGLYLARMRDVRRFARWLGVRPARSRVDTIARIICIGDDL